MRNFLLVFVFMVFVVGCSDGYSMYEKSFMIGCVTNWDSKAPCKCAFDELKKEYTVDDFKRLNNAGRVTPEFERSVFRAGNKCGIRL